MDMNNIKNLMVYSTVQVIAYDATEKSRGTGFFVGKAETRKAYLATNKHVVANYNHAELTFCERNENDMPVDNSHITIDIHDLQSRIISHPESEVDLCFISIDDKIEEERKKGKAPFFMIIGDNLIITQAKLLEMSAIERVLMIGYPAGLIDKTNNKPIVRIGTTATCVSLDYEGEKKYLIDMAVFRGSSGSPIFIEKQETLVEKETLIIRTQYYLAGIVSNTIIQTGDHEVEIVDIPTTEKMIYRTEQYLNLGIVVKAEKISELLNIACSTN